jgi:D-proline reductase (dithiol) PrdB
LPENRTLFEQLSNRFFAIPTVAQWWAKWTARRRAEWVDHAGGIPFARLRKPLAACRGALVTTAGVHLRSQPPFDMENPDGDPTYRVIPHEVALDELMITHKYYDHADADADLNVVFPLAHWRDLVQRGAIGSPAPRHFGMMGHIDGAQLPILINHTAPELAQKLRADQVNFALLTPA